MAATVRLEVGRWDWVGGMSEGGMSRDPGGRHREERPMPNLVLRYLMHEQCTVTVERTTG